MAKHVNYAWSASKDAWLRENRKVAFKDVVAAIENGCLLADIPNPSSNFPHQRAYVVRLVDYVVMVPYIRDQDGVFLKTIYPDRKMRRRFLGN